MRQKILITGSSGTVGTALAQELMKRKIDVIPLDLKQSYWDRRINARTVFHDLRRPITPAILPRGKSRPDMIIHLAANARVHDSVFDPKLAFDNYRMTYNVLEYARQHNVKRVLFSSSREIYGESAGERPRPEDSSRVEMMRSPYTASKYGSEALIAAYADCYGIKSVIARLSNVYGRYDVSERVIPLFSYYAMRNRDITVFGSKKKLDFTFIDDCIDGLTKIVNRFDSVAGHTFNISCGQGERLTDLAHWIVELFDSDSSISVASKRIGEITSFIGDISAARKLLAYDPKVGLRDGLEQTVAWYSDVIREKRIYNLQRRILGRHGWA